MKAILMQVATPLVINKRLHIKFKDGTERTLHLKPTAHICPMQLHGISRPGSLSIIFHQSGYSTIKGRDVSSVDFIVSTDQWDYDDPLN